MIEYEPDSKRRLQGEAFHLSYKKVSKQLEVLKRGVKRRWKRWWRRRR